MKRVLVLAGTSDARELVKQISSNYEVIASLAGATRDPLDLGVETRVGGFGGVDGLARFLTLQNIDILIDATHPFATKITQNAVQAAQKCSRQHCILQRSGWSPKKGDEWYFVDNFQDVAEIIPRGATVFLGTGRQTLDQFSNLSDHRLLCRVIDAPQNPFPFENGQFVVGRPPFTIEQEIAFFKAEKIDWLIVKNAGGSRSRSKLDAACALGLPVVMQRRRTLPDGMVFETVAECAAWLKTLP